MCSYRSGRMGGLPPGSANSGSFSWCWMPLGSLNEADLSKATRIAFSIKDNLGALRNFRAELDGAWLCFTNDKGLAYIYKFDQHCPPGRHTLRVSVEDVAGNRTVKEYNFTR